MSIGVRLDDDVEITTMPSFGIAGLSEPGIYIFIGDEQLTYQGQPITLKQKHVFELFRSLAYELSGERMEGIQDILDKHFPKPLPSDEVIEEELKDLNKEKE